MPRLSFGGLTPLLAKLNRLPADIRQAIDQNPGAIVGGLVDHLATYPPERDGQIYVRTYQLERGWTDAPIQSQYTAGGGITLSINNSVPYQPDVQEEGQQDYFFVDRWETTTQIAAAETDDVARRVDDVASGVTRRI